MIYLYNFFKPISSSKKHSKHIDLQKIANESNKT
ncbi:hypothetical protein BANRA_04442 [Klebsiella pneumoniae]|nr:hypothetical protein BANRA_04442 [Klebsiella pneumoniae]